MVDISNIPNAASFVCNLSKKYAPRRCSQTFVFLNKISTRNIPPINNDIFITELVSCSAIFTGVPPASFSCRTSDRTTSEKISFITAAVITVLPSLVYNIPSCIKTIVVTGTAVIDNNNATNND